MSEALRADREFHFSHRDFEEVRKLIYDHAGIALTEAKEDMVYSRLARRLRATGLKTFKDYLSFLNAGHEEEWEAFVNSLTTNLTDFFRENHHFTILKEFLKTRQDRPIVLWSSAASTGEEPYTMAMTAVEAFGNFNAPVQIIASDLDTNVIKKAEDGVYPVERMKKLSAEQQRRFFLKGTGERAGFVKVRPELRAMVRFFQLNLLAPNWPIRQPVDGIFCRNVMIYFDRPMRAGVVGEFERLVGPGCPLFIGHSETLNGITTRFKTERPSVYRLPEEGR